MGKTYRNVKGAYKANGERNWERRVEQPEFITPEWAMKMMKPRINHALKELLDQGIIKQYEVEDYFWIIAERIADAVGSYDPDRRNDEGRTASATNYLRTIVENSIANISTAAGRMVRDGEEVPIAGHPPDKARALGYVSANDARFSDGCKTVKMLELRMDMNTLVGMLTADELQVLRLRLAGYTVSELSKCLAIPRMRVVRKLIPGIQCKARFCGFRTRDEIRKGREPWGLGKFDARPCRFRRGNRGGGGPKDHGGG